MVVTRPAAAGKRKGWVPNRQEIIWIDCNPQVGREMRDVHPFVVLSPRIFNEKTSLVIGLPMKPAISLSNPTRQATYGYPTHGEIKWRSGLD